MNKFYTWRKDGAPLYGVLANPPEGDEVTDCSEMNDEDFEAHIVKHLGELAYAVPELDGK